MIYFSSELIKICFDIINELKKSKLYFKGVPIFFRPDFRNPFLWTRWWYTKSVFLLKHLTPRVYVDWMSTDIVPSSGGNESIKIETLNVIVSCHDYLFETKLPSFDCKLNFLFKMVFFNYVIIYRSLESHRLVRSTHI